MPQTPQWAGSVWVLAQALAQSVWPAGHAQTPAVQLRPVPQAVPHVPQLVALVIVLTHWLAHEVSPALHVHLPAAQA
jgi:hypothetical protein